MGKPVTQAKRITCICGRPCKGRAGFAAHARSCPQERARSAAFVAAVESGSWDAYRDQYDRTAAR